MDITLQQNLVFLQHVFSLIIMIVVFNVELKFEIQNEGNRSQKYKEKCLVFTRGHLKSGPGRD